MTIGQIACLWLIAALLGARFPASEQSAPSTTIAAERIFIGNSGPRVGDTYQGTGLADDAEKAYSEFFLSMKHWGHFEIVANPARADWIFEVSVGNEETCLDRRQPRSAGDRIENSYHIIVLMTEASTGTVRNRFSEILGNPGFFSSRDKFFDQTIAALVDDVKHEVGAPSVNTPLPAHNEPMAPVPSQIGMAEKVYIHNRGSSDVSTERYSGGDAQLYDQFAAELKRWGRYQIVPASQADLVLDLSFSASPQCNGFNDPQLQLFIVDARTHTDLWAFAAPVGHTILAANARKNFAQGIASLVAQMRDLAGRATWDLSATIPAQSSVVVPPIPAINTSASGPPIPVNISVPSASLKAGNELSAVVTVKNATKQDFTFIYPQGDPLTCVVAVHDADGNPAKDTKAGSRIREAHQAWQGPPQTYKLLPGEKQTRTCAVSKFFELDHPGKYLIEVKQLDGRPAESNVLTVTVVP